MRLTITRAAPKFQQNLAGLHDRFAKAMTATANQLASMWKDAAAADISSAGFGQSWTTAIQTRVDGATAQNMRISLTLDKPGAGIFEKGGVIKGNPLLWIPFSFSDAKGTQASNYGGGLYSVNNPGKRPMLFGLNDKMPKYFGIESVTIPKKFHLDQVQRSVMANFRAIFDTNFRAG